MPKVAVVLVPINDLPWQSMSILGAAELSMAVPITADVLMNVALSMIIPLLAPVLVTIPFEPEPARISLFCTVMLLTDEYKRRLPHVA